MKINNLLIILALTTLIGSCTTPKYVPLPEDVGTELYGSFIMLDPPGGERVKGELIAVNEDALIILDALAKIITIPKGNVGEFRVKYANSQKKYGWRIPVYTLLSAGHGFGLIVSAPVNLAVTTGVSIDAANDFKYNNETIGYEELRMFARFPQGIPEGVRLEDIAKGIIVE